MKWPTMVRGLSRSPAGVATTLGLALVAALTALWLLPASGSGSRDATQQLVAALGCHTLRPIDSDMSFYDEMHGFDCELGRAAGAIDVLMYRRYAHSASVGQVLQDWGPLLSATRQLTWGEDWYAIGPSESVATAASILGGTPPTTQPPSAAPMTASEDELTTCVRFASSTLVSYATDRPAYERDIPSLEKLYPGLRKMVETQMKKDLIVDLRALSQDDSDSFEFQTELSTLGQPVHKFCRIRQGLPS